MYSTYKYVYLWFVADLESQIQDLQEANETAVGELANTERKLEDLQRRNEALQLGQGSQNLDLQEENQRLHDQVGKIVSVTLNTVYCTDKMWSRMIINQLSLRIVQSGWNVMLELSLKNCLSEKNRFLSTEDLKPHDE